jgi:transglutaminase-like putative cysteine protease
VSRFSSLAAGLAAAFLLSVPALAAPKPAFGPPPKWVTVAEAPEAPPADGAPAVQTLLDDNQSRLTPQGDAFYNRRVQRVLKPEGLAAMTTFGVTWDPQDEVVTVHSLKIIRGGKTIDLLGKGRKMLVLRREQDLERAMLDGRMSATQQIEGLQVGDILDTAWTTSGRDPVAGNRSYDMEGLRFPGVAGRYRVRLSWPEGTPIRYRTTEGFGTPKVMNVDGWTYLEMDAPRAESPKPPVGAPQRFRRVGFLETSGFESWNEVSRIMAPLYARAATIAPDSDLRAEIAAIAARTSDPKERAFAALRLVEDKTRYFFVGIGDGGYVPAPADLTWSRKFGDCKGKTVLLLAILKELGVPAEPALVSLGGGDGMNERLPSLAAFNHVIVRSRIDGKVYWLDGTRTGDRSGLEALRPPPHRWALPVRAAGADLEAIEMTPLDAPQLEATLSLDASRGLDLPAALKIRTRLKGDAANAMRQMVAVTPRADLERNFRQQLSGNMSWVEVEKVEWADDAANDAFEIRLAGRADLDWRKNPDLGMREYKVVASSQPAGFPRREPGPNRDAPFAVPFPYFVRAVTEVILPAGGKGFSVRGPSGKEVVGGMELTRASDLAGGVARFTTDVRSLAPEISVTEAEAATRSQRRIAAEDSLIRAPL